MTRAPDEGRRQARLGERLLLGLARLFLIFEDAWPRALPVLGVIAVFIAVALLDVLVLLPAWAHTVVLLGFGLTIAVALSRTPPARPIADSAVRYRIERDSGLRGHPLSTLDDTLADGGDGDGDDTTSVLWRLHKERAARAAATGLRVRLPAPGMAARDPRAWRFAALLILLVGIVVGWQNPTERVARALQPGGANAGHAIAAIDLWITPPAYSGAAPLFLSQPSPDTPIPVAEGSQALVQLSGSGRAPTLRLGDTNAPFRAISKADKTGFRAELELRASGILSIDGARGRSLARWTIQVQPDLPPEVAFAAPPQTIAGARLRLPYQTRDDHGIAALRAVAERDTGERLTVHLATPPRAQKQTGQWQRGTAIQDLSAHRWAGLPVTLWLEATDGLQQTAPSDAIDIILPERTFNHPIARAFVAVRKTLNTPGKEARVDAHTALSGLMETPALFGDSLAIYLGLSTATHRLVEGDSSEVRTSLQDLLWDMALELEDGGLSLAARDVERLKRALDAALAEDPSSDKVTALMEALQNALDRYLAALAEQLKKKGLDKAFEGLDAETIGSDELRDLLDQARDLARTGNQDAARQLLSELSRMMDAMRNGLNAAAGKSAHAKARQLLSDLRTLMGKQSSLHQETFRRVQEHDREDTRLGRTRPHPDALMHQAKQQRGLGQDLKRLSEQTAEMLGKASANLTKAAQAMEDAQQALGAGDGDDGVAAQASALQHLRQAMSSTANALAQKMGGMGVGKSNSGRSSANTFGRDPFGRGAGPGGVAGGDVKVPTKTQRRRARQLRNELRQRAGQPNRPAFERDYINRLLKQF